MPKLFKIFIACYLISVVMSVQAHHSWEPIYGQGKAVSVEAVISDDVGRNPHMYVKVTIMNDIGEPEEWTIEWRGERGRNRQSTTEYDLNPGDIVVIEGRAARDNKRKSIQMTTLTRIEDGMIIKARVGRGGNRGRDNG